MSVEDLAGWIGFATVIVGGMIALGFIPGSRRWAAWSIALGLGVVGIVLGRRFRSRIVLPAELVAADIAAGQASARAESHELTMRAARTVDQSSAAFARATEADAKARRVRAERKVIRDAVLASKPDDLRALAFMRRFKDRQR